MTLRNLCSGWWTYGRSQEAVYPKAKQTMRDPLTFVGEKQNRRQEFVAYILLSNINGSIVVCCGITMERIYCKVRLTRTFLFLLILLFRFLYCFNSAFLLLGFKVTVCVNYTICLGLLCNVDAPPLRRMFLSMRSCRRALALFCSIYI